VTIFGVLWSDLTLEHVQAFLKEAGDEPLLWEAKGTKLDGRAIRRQVCGFANSHEGGYLILGAEQLPGGAGADSVAGLWKLDGVEFPDEPATWVSNVIGDPEGGVRPVPDFDVAAWPAPDGHVAVVRVIPTSTPPCMTNGTVYERVPGRTITVRDPLRLAGLFTRGDNARREAKARADRVALILHEAKEGGVPDPAFVRFTVAVTATGNSPDIAHNLFRHEFATRLWEKLDDRSLGWPRPYRRRPDPVEWSQAALTCRHETRGPILNALTVVRVSWDGAAAVHQQIATDIVNIHSLVESRVQPEWRLADELVSDLGGFGDVYVTVLINGGPVPRPVEAPDYVVMRRGPILPGIEEAHVASLDRELKRTYGDPAPEP